MHFLFDLRRAKRANEDGSFKWEIAAVTVQGRKGDTVIDRDEQPFKANIEKIPSLKPAFAKDGTVTAANSSSISDGAAALVMMRESTAKRLGVKPIARVVGHSTFAQEPALFMTAPVGAISRLACWRATSLKCVMSLGKQIVERSEGLELDGVARPVPRRR